MSSIQSLINSKLIDSEIFNTIFQSGLKISTKRQFSPPVDLILREGDEVMHVITPIIASSRVLLPVEEGNKGLVFILINTHANSVIFVRNSVSTETRMRLGGNQAGIVICDGVSWQGIRSNLG